MPAACMNTTTKFLAPGHDVPSATLDSELDAPLEPVEAYGFARRGAGIPLMVLQRIAVALNVMLRIRP